MLPYLIIQFAEKQFVTRWTDGHSDNIVAVSLDKVVAVTLDEIVAVTMIRL